MSLPDPHQGETVVEPGMVDGRSVDMSGAPLFAPVAKSFRAVRMVSPFFITRSNDDGTRTGIRQVGAVYDILAEDPDTGERWVIRADHFNSTYQEVK